MANNDTKKKGSDNELLNSIKNLNTTTKATSQRTYGVSRDINDMLTQDTQRYLDKINADRDNDMSMVNSYMTKSRMRKNAAKSVDDANLYDIIKDKKMMDSVQSLVGSENMKYAQTLKDYEVIKRCIPQVHKVITSLCNNIISPDAMADSSIGIEIPAGTSSSDKDVINKIIEDYKLNKSIKDWVMSYLIASVDYATVVPYSSIPDMLSPDTPLSESINILEEAIPEPKTLLECTSGLSKAESLTESVTFEGANITEKYTLTTKDYESAVNESLNNIEFYNGGLSFYKKDIINEVMNESIDLGNSSMKNVLKTLKDGSATKSYSIASEGMISDKTIADIKKKVKFKGCHIETLVASKTIPFKLRNTVIGYFYAEDAVDTGLERRNSLSTIMDKINSTVYMKTDPTNSGKDVEKMVISTISDRLIKAINPKFLTDNAEDMDIIYEFVRANELHLKKKRVVFFHPDDVAEFRRSDGSIMKNCMFMAKLYILTMLNNVITKVTRGGDRNIHYIKTGLTTDIEGHVNSAIRAIKQNQVRYSDLGSINEIFNIVGSGTDVFMPVSIDGDKPIETETISGQQVDMDNDFLSWIIKSIIQSFGAPSSVIDDYENVEYAKTIAMSNIDMAKLCLDAQNEINEPLTKLIRLIVHYELPDFQNEESIYAKLNPPSVIITEMNRQKSDAVATMADTIASLALSPDVNETQEQKAQREFKLKYFKKYMPTIDWDGINDMIKETAIAVKKNLIDSNISDDSGDTDNSQY